MRAALAVAAIWLFGCAQKPELSLAIRLPADESGLKSVNNVILAATRNGIVLAQSSFSASARTVSLGSVSHGASTVISLDGVDANNNVIAHGRTCAFDFEASGMSVPLYFAPTSFFAPAVDAPIVRQYPTVAPLTSGIVLVAGGSDGSALVDTTELFTPGSGTFASDAALKMNNPRWHAESIALPSIGVLIVGGIDQGGSVISAGELYYEAQQAFLPISDLALDGRVEHRLALVASTAGSSVFIAGGSHRLGGSPLASTLIAQVLTNGNYRISTGPTLVRARRAHAMVAPPSENVVLVFGGYDANGVAMDSIELVDLEGGTANEIGHLLSARAEATASFIPDVGILIAGGIGSDGSPRVDAELYHELSRTSTLKTMRNHRYAHSATVLDNGDVLIAGGNDAGGSLSTTDLFLESELDFVTGRDLAAPRAGHVAATLCDGTVLLVGGAAGAELYTAPTN